MSIIRNITLKAEKYLDQDDILLFIGPRQAGKTTILKQLQGKLEHDGETVFSLNLEDPDYLKLLDESPKNLFKIFTFDNTRRTVVILDEVQYLKNPSNFLKYFYDEYKGKIKILASGSSAFYIDQHFKDSLAGRKKIFQVLTLSFQEFLNFKNEPELAKKDLKKISLSEKEKIEILYREYMIYGGYPRIVLAPAEEKIDLLHELAYSYIKKDIFEAHIRQDQIFYKLIKILATQVGNLLNTSELANTLGVSKTSIDHYITVMQKTFHIHLIRPFFQNIRKELTKMPKIFFSDMGLRNFFTGEFKNFEMRNDQGQLLENAVFRELLEENQIDNIHFWRTADGHEIDFIINKKNAYEVKTNNRKILKKNFSMFEKTYPEIPISIISLNKTEEQDEYAALQPWEIAISI